MRESLTQDYLKHLESFVGFCLPQFEKEGKAYLSIAIGCTGGRHRSVVLTNWLADQLSESGYNARATHRDLRRSTKERDAKLAAQSEHNCGETGDAQQLSDGQKDAL
jgi:hypothetical protein